MTPVPMTEIRHWAQKAKRRPGEGGVAASAIGEIDAADNTAAAAPPQVVSPAVRRLIEHIGQDRAIRLERAAALTVAYGALRRADELGADCDLRRAATVALRHLAATRADLAGWGELELFAGLEP